MNKPPSVTRHINSFFNSVSYVVNDETLVDCGDWHQEYAGVKAVLLTHAHFDHIYGLNKLLERVPDAAIYTNLYGCGQLFDAKRNLSKYHDMPFELTSAAKVIEVGNGAEIPLTGGYIAKAYFTPGHCPSCITWVIEDCVFSGDAFIPGVRPVTNLPGGNKADAQKSIEFIKGLTSQRRLFPGHPAIPQLYKDIKTEYGQH